jgi:hypothetical protein
MLDNREGLLLSLRHEEGRVWPEVGIGDGGGEGFPSLEGGSEGVISLVRGTGGERGFRDPLVRGSSLRLSRLLSGLGKLLKQLLNRCLLSGGLLQLLLRILSASSFSSAVLSAATPVTSFSALLLLLLLLEIRRLVTGWLYRAKLMSLLLVFTSPLSSMILPSLP